MRWALRGAPFFLLLSLSALPAAAGSFTLSLPGDSKVTIDSPSRLAFKVTNTDGSDGLSRIALRFPSGYRVTNGSAPPGWTADLSTGAEITFRTSDEAKCTGAIAPGSALVFGVEAVAPPSRSVTPDSLVSAQGEQSCRGVALDPPATLPSWDRLGIGVALAVGPSILGLGGEATVTMTVTNLSTVELADISALLGSTGTGGVARLVGPTPASLALAPGASGRMTWTGRAASPGAVSFRGQATGKGVTSPPVRSDTLYVGDLDVSLTVRPERVVSGREVRVQMTVKNRGAVRLVNVTPSPLTFDGTAGASEAAGPSPSSQAVLEPGESATFSWAATIAGKAGETYAFSGRASAEGEGVVAADSMSNRGAVAQQEGVPQSQGHAGSDALGGGGAAGSSQSAGASGQDTGSTASTAGSTASTAGSTASTAGATASTAGSTASTGASVPPAVPSATLQLIGVNQDGSSTGGTDFSSGLLRYLRILVGWQNLSGTHTQRLRLFSPDGSFYQGFSTGVGSSPTETRLLVGGTWITEFSLFGAWRVEVFLDSQQMPITSGVFVLTP